MNPPICCPGAYVEWAGQSGSSGSGGATCTQHWHCHGCGKKLTTKPEGSS